MSQHMMDDPLTLGAEHQLGNYKATYQPHMLTRQDVIFYIVAGLLYSLFLLCILIFATPLRAMPLTNKIIITIISVFLGSFLSGCIIWDICVKRALRIFYYENGLIYRGRKSLQTIIYWQNVQSVMHKVKVVGGEYGSKTIHISTLNCIDGTSLRLDDVTFPELEPLMASIEGEIARNLFPVALSAYQIGHTVLFGPLAITQEGVRYRKRVFPWSEVKGVSTDGHIRFQKHGKRLKWIINVNQAKVPNIGTLRMLIQHIIGVVPPES